MHWMNSLNLRPMKVVGFFQFILNRMNEQGLSRLSQSKELWSHGDSTQLNTEHNLC